MRIFRTISLTFAFISIFALSGCIGQGRELNYNDAQTYFANHKEQLEAIISAEEKCQPVYQNSDLAIRTDGISSIPCANGDYKPVAHIRDMLKKADIQMLFTIRENDNDRVSKFLMHSEGLGVSGGGTYIVNTAMPSKPNEIYLDTQQEVRPMKVAPDHWFWGQGSS
jgi:hypothetical protein